MITMGLLTLIVLGLMLMFNQTQRAFRISMTQSDVLEAGRATMDMAARDLSQMTPSQYPLFQSPFGGYWQVTNFFVELSPSMLPLEQQLPGNPSDRTNVIQRFFFLSKVNQDWIGAGYQVLPDDTSGAVGALYRFSMTNYPRFSPITLSANFQVVSRIALRLAALGLTVTNADRIADGIVHLRLRAFANNGFLIVPDRITGTNGVFLASAPYGPYTNVWNTTAYASLPLAEQAACYFTSNAVPAYVELELGILEPQILQHYLSIPVMSARLDYLSNHVAQVHLFRQRIPVVNVDNTAYP